MEGVRVIDSTGEDDIVKELARGEHGPRGSNMEVDGR